MKAIVSLKSHRDVGRHVQHYDRTLSTNYYLEYFTFIDPVCIDMFPSTPVRLLYGLYMTVALQLAFTTATVQIQMVHFITIR